jgi:hypothetical protein
MSGKGSKPRPIEIERDVFESNWDKIFSKKETPSDMWNHHCKHNGELMISRGQECSWCGETEDGETET